MRITLFLIIIFLMACQPKKPTHLITEISIAKLLTDSISIRAITLSSDKLYYAGNNGRHGNIDLSTNMKSETVTQFDSLKPEFRAIVYNNENVFILSVANPALLYRMDKSNNQELVYREDGEDVFYDAMKFWNDKEGIAIGDILDGCLSIITTRDGGETWQKTNCSQLPPATENEGAFAASNTNIEIQGDFTWVATTSSRVYFSDDKGHSWQIYETPIVKEKETQGIYSIDFHDKNIGIAFGGDYTEPEVRTSNKAMTFDGGKSWKLIADGQDPGYKSCVQFIPGSNGKEIVAVGFTGIHYSSDQGQSWKKLSDQSLYTIRFLNDFIAYAAGANIIAKLSFK